MRETKEKFEALTGGKVFEGFGLSEAPTATHCNPLMGENRTGSIGLPLPDVDVRIVSLDDEVTVLPAGEVGELVIKGPMVFKGYHNMPTETATPCGMAGCTPAISLVWTKTAISTSWTARKS